MALQDANGVKQEGVGTFKGYMMPPSHITVDPDFNPRDMTAPETVAHVEDIAAQIQARGFDLDRPLLGRSHGDKFVVTDGHCRFAAVQLLLAKGEAIKAIPVRTEPAGTDPAERLAFTLRAPGLPLTALAAAIAIKKLMGYGWTEDDVAKRQGRTVAWVKSCLDLAAAPQEIREAVREGVVSPSAAVALVREEGPETAVKVLADAQEIAAERGSERVRPRDIAAATPSDDPADKQADKQAANQTDDGETNIAETLDAGLPDGEHPVILKTDDQMARQANKRGPGRPAKHTPLEKAGMAVMAEWRSLPKRLLDDPGVAKLAKRLEALDSCLPA